jgi:hypothetical protein
MRRARSLKSNSPGEHEHPRLVAHNSDVSLAGGGILYPKHVTWTEPSRLTISRRDRKDTTQDDSKLSRWGRMVETGLEVMSAPGGVESSEENAGGRNVASDIDRSCRWSEVHFTELDCYVLKMRVPFRGAIQPHVSETGRIMRALASRYAGVR